MLLFLNVCEQIFHIRTCAYQEVNVNIALNIYGSVVYGSFIYYVRKIFRKTNISYPLIRTRTCECTFCVPTKWMNPQESDRSSILLLILKNCEPEH